MHLLSKSHNYYKKKNRIFVNINLDYNLNNCEFASCACVNKEKSNTDILAHKMKSVCPSVRPPRHLKNDSNMDSVIPPFWKNPPPDLLGLSG